MGVVYSPEEVALGHVAKPGDHQALGRLLLSAAAESRYIQAGIIYGSSVFGTAGIRSDVDYLAIYDNDDALKAFAALREAKQCAVQRGIYAVAEEHWEPETPFVKPGQVDKQYLAHFTSVARKFPSWLVNDPVSYIDQTPLSKGDLLFSTRQYVSAKTAKFTKTACDLSPDYHDIQRALELPVAIARKVMLVMRPYYDSMAETENKKAMATLSHAILTHSKIAQIEYSCQASHSQERLLYFDQEYSSVLKQAVYEVSLRKNTNGYEKWLGGHTREILDQAFLLSTSWQRILDSIE
jgi:hypothetical protein